MENNERNATLEIVTKWEMGKTTFSEIIRRNGILFEKIQQLFGSILFYNNIWCWPAMPAALYI